MRARKKHKIPNNTTERIPFLDGHRAAAAAALTKNRPSKRRKKKTQTDPRNEKKKNGAHTANEMKKDVEKKKHSRHD